MLQNTTWSKIAEQRDGLPVLHRHRYEKTDMMIVTGGSTDLEVEIEIDLMSGGEDVLIAVARGGTGTKTGMRKGDGIGHEIGVQEGIDMTTGAGDESVI